MKRIATLSLSVILGAAAPGTFAQSGGMGNHDAKGMDMKSMDMKRVEADKKGMTTTHRGTGVVKNINTADGVVTLAHGPIKTLNWPAMTMGFKLEDKAWLSKIKPGDKVEFTFVQVDRSYVITGMK